jgi:hypothetical protein
MAEQDAVGLLRRLADDVGPPVELGALLASPAAAFPAAHLELLRQLNGMTVGAGAYRLFGVRAETHLDIGRWNAPQTWRFAWDERVEEFLIFGETAWGEQFAYRRVGPGPELGPEVYVLESTQLRPAVIAPSFEDFLTGSFTLDAQQPRDPYTVAALRRLHRVAADQHWVFAPPLPLGGPDSVDNVIELRAVTAMVFAGDLALALESHLDTVPTSVVPWVDGLGRDRLRVDYGPAIS